MFPVLLVLLSLAQTPQSRDARVAVTVVDQTGAVIPNATVTLKNTETGTVQTRTTNAQGAYRFPLLNPGTYTVTAAAQGFQGREQRVAVTVGQATTVNSQLALASASQTVEVTAEGGVVQTENGNVRGFVRKWRARNDSNVRPSDS